MRLLADENVPLVVVAALRDAGHDTASVREEEPGSSDERVLARAMEEDRILVTFDKDFGAWVFSHGFGACPGVVLFRVVLPPDELARFVIETLASRGDWRSNFSVVTVDRVRMRPLAAS